MGHKIALRPIRKGEAVLKYGQIIGFASQDIAPGDHVHVHNVDRRRLRARLRLLPRLPAAAAPPAEPRTWMGYDRGDGRLSARATTSPSSAP